MQTSDQPFGPCPVNGCTNGIAKGMDQCREHSAPSATADELQDMLKEIAAYWRGRGFVITIEQVPLQPLAMGNHEDRVTVRKANAQ